MLGEEKFKISNLFVVHIGVKSSGTTYAKETIICKRKKDSYDHYWFTDIFTNNSYRLSSDYRSNVGEAVAFNPVSLISVFKPGEFKDKLLQAGSTTKTELIAIYNALNNENGYVMTIEKLKLDEPQEITIMNKKKYSTPPTIFRNKELETLMISLAMNKKITLITGDNGVGKTSLIDQLAYLIQHNQTPDFLKRQPIFEINIPRLKMNKKTKDLDQKIKEIIDYAKSKNAILFIDEADEILEANEDNINTIALLRYAAERENLKLIVTVSQETYQKNQILKDKFDIIELKEPNDQELIEIAKEHIKNKSKETNISTSIIKDYLDDIIEVLIGSTKSPSINFVTNQRNPGLLLEIINTSFAIAQTKKEKHLLQDHVIDALKRNNNLDKQQVNKAINILNELKNTSPKSDKAKQLVKLINN